MNSKHLKGLAVIDLLDGTKLGTVDQAMFNPAAKCVVGFSVVGGATGGLAADGLTIATAMIHALGPDAMTVDNAAAAHAAWVNAAYGPLVPLDDLLKRKVITEGGTDIGEIASVEFDEVTFAVTGMEISPGFFTANTHLTGDHVRRIGMDVVVVADAVTVAGAVTDRASPTPA